eukprot:3881627-Amphidinium_carterae.1
MDDVILWQRRYRFVAPATVPLEVRVLICNFQEQGSSLSVLFGLDDMCAEGSEVVLYTNMSNEQCMEVVHQVRRRVAL